MRTPIKMVAALSALSVAVGGGLSIATAKTHHRQTNQGPSGQQQGPRRGGPPFIKAAATYLGLDVKSLCDQLKAGKTLADVAAAQNKSVDGLKQAIYDDAKSHMDQAVADGKLTSDQETARLSDLQSHLDDIVNKTPPKHPQGPPPPPMGGQQGPSDDS